MKKIGSFVVGHHLAQTNLSVENQNIQCVFHVIFQVKEEMKMKRTTFEATIDSSTGKYSVYLTHMLNFCVFFLFFFFCFFSFRFLFCNIHIFRNQPLVYSTRIYMHVQPMRTIIFFFYLQAQFLFTVISLKSYFHSQNV